MGYSPAACALASRYGFAALLAAVAGARVLGFLLRRVVALHDQIRDERFLLGTRLLNLHERPPEAAPPLPAAAQ